MELLTANNVWMMVCTFLVLFMHLGFSFLEIGLTRQKNTVNILFKNFFVITMGIITYCLIGFNLMYPGEFGIIDNVLGFPGPGLDPGADYDQLTYADGGYTYWTDYLFQAMFAATAATIISGAVAERIKITSFILIAILFVVFVYPIVGSWQWGGGFFDSYFGFYDFAGSTLVHSVGGWGALIVIYFLGARKGKFDSSGNPVAIPGSNIPLSAAGVLILWLGWFGFNGGSVLSADPALTSLTLVTTCLAAAAMGIYDAMLIGIISGPIVVFGVALLDKCKLDDPVGAIPVHLFCGIWGTLAVGCFGAMKGFEQFMIQLACVGIAGLFCVVMGVIIVQIVKAVAGLRVSEEEEEKGLDIAEHGTGAYADFSKA